MIFRLANGKWSFRCRDGHTGSKYRNAAKAQQALDEHMEKVHGL